MASQNQIGSLFNGAAAAGTISPDTAAMLTGHLGPVVIAGAAGTALVDIQASDVTLITVLIDSSSSIAYANLEQAVRDGQNSLVDAFAAAKEAPSILMALWTFNAQIDIIHSYVPVADATRLDEELSRHRIDQALRHLVRGARRQRGLRPTAARRRHALPQRGGGHHRR